MFRRILLYLLYVAIVVGLVAAIIFAFKADTKSKKPVVKHPAGQSLQKTKPSISSSPPAAKKPATPPKVKTPTKPAPEAPAAPKVATPSPAPVTKPATDGTAQLNNTGPSGVVTLFAVSFLLGSVGFNRYQRKTL